MRYNNERTKETGHKILEGYHTFYNHIRQHEGPDIFITIEWRLLANKVSSKIKKARKTN